MKKTLKIIIAIIVVGLAGTLAISYFEHSRLYPSTDDAYVQAHVAHIAPQIPGNINTVNITNNQAVKKGQVLFTIDPASYKIAVDKARATLNNTIQTIQAEKMAVVSAKAQVAETKAQLTNAKQTANRIIKLAQKGNASLANKDKVTSELNVAIATKQAAVSELAKARATLGASGTQNAQLQEAEAALSQAQLNLAHTIIRAPANGNIANLTLREGDEVQTGQNVFALVENANWWVQANMKETNIDRIKPNQPASITVDMYPDHTFHGTVQSISRGSGTTFALLPPENATGNWVKVTQRFPVRVKITDPSAQFPLRVGASATVTINTTQ